MSDPKQYTPVFEKDGHGHVILTEPSGAAKYVADSEDAAEALGVASIQDVQPFGLFYHGVTLELNPGAEVPGPKLDGLTGELNVALVSGESVDQYKTAQPPVQQPDGDPGANTTADPALQMGVLVTPPPAAPAQVSSDDQKDPTGPSADSGR